MPPNSSSIDKGFSPPGMSDSNALIEGSEQPVLPQLCSGPSGNIPSEFSEGPIRYADGVIKLSTTDIASDGFGTTFSQTRSWSNNPSYAADAGGSNGNGWIDSQFPTLVEASGTATLAVISNGTTARYFDASGGGYTERFFGEDVLSYDTGSAGYDLTTPDGYTYRFEGFSSSTPASEQGQMDSVTDPYGNVTQVTSRNSAGQVTEVQRGGSADGASVLESWVYSYLGSGDANAGLLASVTLRREATTGGSWATVREVDYTYYDGTTANGNLHDLEMATVKDADGNSLGTDYYRYYVDGTSGGYVGGLKYYLSPASFDRATGAGYDPLTATDAQIAPYADNYFQYDSSHRVSLEDVQGQGCSACSGGIGQYTFSYTASSNTAGFNSWAMKTVEGLPDGNENIVYTNAYGEIMLFAYHDTTSGDKWIDFYQYDSSGRVTLAASPSAVAGYDDSYADLLHQVSGNYVYLSDSAGLITTYDYYTSTTATSTTAGGVAGNWEGEAIQQGETGTSIPQLTLAYYQITPTSTGVPINPLATQTVYRNTDGSGAETTTYSYTFFSGTGQVQTVTLSYPVIDTAENGPGTADTETGVSDQFGRLIWLKDRGGFLHSYTYDTATSVMTSETDDVNTSLGGSYPGLPSGWATPSGGGLNLESTDEVDALGRVTEFTSPAGNVTYQVYDDVDHEVRVYAGWNTTTNAPTGPTTVVRDDRLDGYTEKLTMSAAPHLTSSLPDGTESIADVQTLSRTYTNDAGQAVTSDAYFNLSGLTYSTSTSLGTSGTNYYQTTQAYDSRGRPDKTVSPTGTITRTVYDGLGREVSSWVGTDDTPGSGYWSPTNNTSPSNMVETSSFEYDGTSVGDGNLTQETDYPNDGTANRVTQNFYDWRDRLVATKGGVQTTESTSVHRPISYVQYDNLSEVVSEESFDGDGVSITSTGGVPNAPSSSLLRAKTTTSYDDQGRVYQSDTWSVNSSSGAVSTYALHTDTWYDTRGDVMKEADPGGLVTKTAYDGVGRPTIVYSTDGGDDAAPGASGSWTDAGNVTGDAVLDQMETSYDGDGNVILTADRQRFDDATGTGALGTPSTGVPARVYFMAYYYDAADRPTASVNVGTNGGSAYTRPSSVPSRSDTVLVTSTGYNDAGWASSVTDPSGIVTETSYDNLGRTTQTIENYTGSAPSAEADKTTQFTYDGDNHMLTYKLILPSSYQTTQYNYGVSTSTIASNDLLASVYHPDPSTGAASSSQADTYTYNALGETTGFTDRNGTAHAYSFDVLGRPTADAVTLASGSTVDNSVLRLETAYDTQGNPYLLTSYNATSGGSIVNQVLRQYNGLGQLTAEFQANSGAVDTSTTPAVYYTYTEMAGGANNSRLTEMSYGWFVDYNYGSSGSVDDRISRMDQEVLYAESAIEDFTYLGLSTVVQRLYLVPDVKMTYVGTGTGDAGDKYVGLDRFGRIVDQRWATFSGTNLVNYAYGYDRDGNMLYQQDLVNSAMSQLYTYDNLNQLTSFERGTLSSDDTAITGTPSATESWSPDAAGNFTSVTTNGTAVSRTANAQNEMTTDGSLTLTYDADGNTTTDDQSHTLVYDAWNRLVDVKSGSTDLAAYSYDALSRRIGETHGSTTTTLLVSAADQVVFETTGSVYTTYFWDPTAVDALQLRIVDTDTSETQMYAMTTATGDVAAVTNWNGTMQERYAYDPYGQVTFLTPTYGSRSASAIGWVYLHQGMRWDSVVDLYDNRARAYSPTLMRFLQNDPIGFMAGDQNTYRYEGDAPTGHSDPTGLATNPLGGGIAKAFLEFFPDKGVAEIKIIRNGVELVRYRWSSAAPEVVEEILMHGGRALPGVSASFMKRISYTVSYNIKEMVRRMGGKWAASMLPNAVRAGLPETGVGAAARGAGLFGLVIWVFTVLDMTAGNAWPAEIPRPWNIEIPLSDLGLDENLNPIVKAPSSFPGRAQFIGHCQSGNDNGETGGGSGGGGDYDP